MEWCQVPSAHETLLNMLQTYTSQFRETRYSTYSFELMHMLASSITRINWQSSPVSKERPCSPLDLPVARVNTVSPTVEATLAHTGMMAQEDSRIPEVPMAITVRMHLKFTYYSLLCLFYVQARCWARLKYLQGPVCTWRVCWRESRRAVDIHPHCSMFILAFNWFGCLWDILGYHGWNHPHSFITAKNWI